MLSIMTLGIITLSIMTLSIMTLSIMTLSIMTLGIMTLGIMTLGIMTLSIMALIIMTDLRHSAKIFCFEESIFFTLMPSVIMLSVGMGESCGATFLANPEVISTCLM